MLIEDYEDGEDEFYSGPPTPECPRCLSRSGVVVEKEPNGIGYVAWCCECWNEGMSVAAFGRTADDALEELALSAEN